MSAPEIGDVIRTAEGRDALPAGIVVLSGEGSLAGRYNDEYGVVLGDERPFPWRALDLPLVVLYSGGRLPRSERVVKAEALREAATDPGARERARKLVEDELVEWRDARRFTLRNNGLAIKEADGTPSHVIRFGFELGWWLALEAEADRVEAGESE